MPDNSFRALAIHLRANARDLVRETSDELIERLKLRSRGGLSPADLRRLDHPYARRHGSPLLDPSVVNRDRGDFEEGWTATELDPDGYSEVVFNSDPKAEYLAQEDPEPTSTTMFQRPIADVVFQEQIAHLDQKLDHLLP